MLYIMELANYSVQRPTNNLLVLAKILGIALRMRAINMVWSDGRNHIMGKMVMWVVAYSASARMDICITQAKSRTHRTITRQ
jgi:hypothetical protein